jgi:hypothetical protein
MITLKNLLEHLLEDKRVAYYHPNFIWIESLGIKVEVLISTGKLAVHYAFLMPVGIGKTKILGNMLIKRIGLDQGYIKETDELELSTEEIEVLREEFNNLFIFKR